ncbi:hypothetical protein [Streptomyces sp. MMBL 11-1]|uniref:hypothetical protein n=1 Tax=Streptomyces sp. MMBL 11-1 TaxID=3026420 RepID=UPI00235E7330|nr:hypothetical protein [Streptomyces sp. MMBL 11-1]
MNPPVPELQTPAAPALDGHTSPLPRIAPGALVRTTLLSLPAEPAPAAAFRAALAELVVLEGRLTALAPALGDALYASRADHTEEYHREVVLPLRRAVHNGRAPRPALLRRLEGLPDRLPELRAWLTARRRREELLTALRAGAGPALSAGRSVLAGLCREPSFLRAASFTSADLLRAVVRAGQGREDRRTRKEEPGVLRHVTAGCGPYDSAVRLRGCRLGCPAHAAGGEAGSRPGGRAGAGHGFLARAGAGHGCLERRGPADRFVPGRRPRQPDAGGHALRGAGRGPAPSLHPAAPHVQQSPSLRRACRLRPLPHGLHRRAFPRGGG